MNAEEYGRVFLSEDGQKNRAIRFNLLATPKGFPLLSLAHAPAAIMKKNEPLSRKSQKNLKNKNLLDFFDFTLR
jgi:hypothetical protein